MLDNRVEQLDVLSLSLSKALNTGQVPQVRGHVPTTSYSEDTLRTSYPMMLHSSMSWGCPVMLPSP